MSNMSQEILEVQSFVEENFTKFSSAEDVYVKALEKFGGMFASYAKDYYQDTSSELFDHYEEVHDVECFQMLCEELGEEIPF